jgi:hypothetical protein
MNKPTSIFPLIVIVCFLITGCTTSPWEKFYTEIPQGTFVPYCGETRVFFVSNKSEADSYLRAYQYCMGSSDFFDATGRVTRDDLKLFGEKIGADAVVYWIENRRIERNWNYGEYRAYYLRK